ncbi:hypothetical protein CF326_g5481 [Tilletia indica]|nr:hypothetical protein CF326_g5481 [Tilletia indica]
MAAHRPSRSAPHINFALVPPGLLATDDDRPLSLEEEAFVCQTFGRGVMGELTQEEVGVAIGQRALPDTTGRSLQTAASQLDDLVAGNFPFPEWWGHFPQLSQESRCLKEQLRNTVQTAQSSSQASQARTNDSVVSVARSRLLPQATRADIDIDIMYSPSPPSSHLPTHPTRSLGSTFRVPSATPSKRALGDASHGEDEYVFSAPPSAQPRSTTRSSLGSTRMPKRYVDASRSNDDFSALTSAQPRSKRIAIARRGSSPFDPCVTPPSAQPPRRDLSTIRSDEEDSDGIGSDTDTDTDGDNSSDATLGRLAAVAMTAASGMGPQVASSSAAYLPAATDEGREGRTESESDNGRSSSAATMSLGGLGSDSFVPSPPMVTSIVASENEPTATLKSAVSLSAVAVSGKDPVGVSESSASLPDIPAVYPSTTTSSAALLVPVASALAHAPSIIWALKDELRGGPAQYYRGPLSAEAVKRELARKISKNARIALTGVHVGYLRYYHFLGNFDVPAEQDLGQQTTGVQQPPEPSVVDRERWQCRSCHSYQHVPPGHISNLGTHLYGFGVRTGCLEDRRSNPVEDFPPPARNAAGLLVREGAGKQTFKARGPIASIAKASKPSSRTTKPANSVPFGSKQTVEARAKSSGQTSETMCSVASGSSSTAPTVSHPSPTPSLSVPIFFMATTSDMRVVSVTLNFAILTGIHDTSIIDCFLSDVVHPLETTSLRSLLAECVSIPNTTAVGENPSKLLALRLPPNWTNTTASLDRVRQGSFRLRHAYGFYDRYTVRLHRVSTGSADCLLAAWTFLKIDNDCELPALQADGWINTV